MKLGHSLPLYRDYLRLIATYQDSGTHLGNNRASPSKIYKVLQCPRKALQSYYKAFQSPIKASPGGPGGPQPRFNSPLIPVASSPHGGHQEKGRVEDTGRQTGVVVSLPCVAKPSHVWEFLHLAILNFIHVTSTDSLIAVKI